MRIYLASDHAGFELKKTLIPYIASLEGGYDVEDLGPETLDPTDDYPQLIGPCAERVAKGGSLGIIIGSSGQGEAMVANRHDDVRAAVFYGVAHTGQIVEEEGTVSTDPFDIVRVARRHNDANILSLGARFVSEEDAKQAVKIFLETSFSDLERHARRIAEF
jgi:ribose 5-phosphate isomerase B